MVERWYIFTLKAFRHDSTKNSIGSSFKQTNKTGKKLHRDEIVLAKPRLAAH